MLKDIKVLKELCEMTVKLTTGRFIAIWTLIFLFGAGFLIGGIAKLQKMSSTASSTAKNLNHWPAQQAFFLGARSDRIQIL